MVRIGSLFSGAGGLDLAVLHVFGGQVVWHVENEPAASRVLAHHWPGVPNHGDITSTDWTRVEPVDILAAGWPCQPFSTAGRRKGADDHRALWPYVAGAVRLLRPRTVVLENVSAVLTAGEFDRAAADLATLGYEFAWTCLRAADIGAPHQRERLFILAHATGHRLARVSELGRTARELAAVDLLPTPRTSDTNGAGQHGHGGLDLRTAVALLPTPKTTDHDINASPGEVSRHTPCLGAIEHYQAHWGKYAPAIRRWESLTRPPPPPTEPNRTGKSRLNPAFSEWMMGWPQGWVTDLIGRNDALRIIGNGVVPQQAAAALTWLLRIGAAA